MDDSHKMADVLWTQLQKMTDDPRAMHGAVMALRDMLPARFRGAPRKWLCRLLLIDPSGSVEADSMAGVALDAEPDAVLYSLLDAARWARVQAEAFHEQSVEGLDDATIAAARNTARVGLSRNKGRHWWNLRYTVNGATWRATILVIKGE